MADDLLDISQVSGFYGPGAWAAWYLSLLASWMAIIRGDYTHNVHHIGHMLYTNWASFDLYRRALHLSGDNHIGDGERGRLAAAFAVTFWGQFHGLAQLVFCFHDTRTESRRSKSPADIRRRTRILLCGLDFPSLAVLCFITKVLTKMNGGTGSKGRMLIPALYFDGITHKHHHVILLIVSSLMAAQGMVIHSLVGLMIARFFPANIPFSPSTFRLVKRLTVTIYGASILVQLYSATLYLVRLMATSGEIYQQSCYFMPCAPQSISEVDQAFAVFFALFMVLYEFGPKLVWPMLADSYSWWRIMHSEDSVLKAGSLL